MEFLPVQWFETLPSTNTWLLEQAEKNPDLPSGTVIAAATQTAGRGRFEHHWLSSPGRDLTFSFLLRAALPASRLPSLPMACALGVVSYLANMNLPAQTKWSNDVLVEGKKICGILTERIANAADNEIRAVVGIGLNLNLAQEEVERIDQPATSVAIERGNAPSLSPEVELSKLLLHLESIISKWEAGGFPAIRQDWEAKTIGMGRSIGLRTNQQVITGVLQGFGEAGELLLQDPAGEVRPVWSGELGLPEQD